MWFVEFEGSKGWETSWSGESHEHAMRTFEALLFQLNKDENEGVDSEFDAVRIEYRRN